MRTTLSSWIRSAHPLPLAATGYLAAFFLVYGMYFTDLPSLVLLHTNVYALLPPASQFLHSSILGPLVAFHLGLSNALSIRIFYSVIVIAFLAAFYIRLSALAKQDRRTLIVLLSLVALTPYLHILLSWIGKPDPLVMLLFLAFSATRSSIMRNAIVFLMLLTHREVACFMLLIWAILYGVPWRTLSSLIPGTLLAIVWYALYGMVLGGYADRAAYVLDNSALILSDAITGFPLIMFLAFSWFWGILGALIVLDTENRWRIVLACAIVIVLAFAALDHVRVPLTAALPLVLFALERVVALGWIAPLRRFMIVFLIAGLIHVEYNTGVLYASYWPMLLQSHMQQIEDTWSHLHAFVF